MAELLGELFQRSGPVQVGTYAHTDGVAVVVQGEAGGGRPPGRNRPFLAEGGPLGEDGDSLPTLALERLQARGATLATLESMTGRHAERPAHLGRRRFQGLPGGLLAYHPQAKAHLGLPAEGMVSAAAAEAMATLAREQLGATYGLATTGVAGPEELEGQPVGTLYVGLAGPEGARSRHYHLPGASREVLRQRAAHAALAFLLGALQ